MSAPQALIIGGDGINCDLETAHIVQTVGFEVAQIHVSELLENPGKLEKAKLICLPGGFSFGDEIASGKVLALKLRTHLQEALQKFITRKRLVMGICNGFQVLTQLGLLPFPQTGAPRVVSLTRNVEKKFRNKWISLEVSKSQSSSIFFKGLQRIDLPIRHGEGNLKLEPQPDGMSASAYSEVQATVKNLASLRYVEDVNGSFDRIAALSGEDGTVMGLMPHPEAFVRFTQHPCWTQWRSGEREHERSGECQGDGRSVANGAHRNAHSTLHSASPSKPDGLVIFENAFQYCNSL